MFVFTSVFSGIKMGSASFVEAFTGVIHSGTIPWHERLGPGQA